MIRMARTSGRRLYRERSAWRAEPHQASLRTAALHRIVRGSSGLIVASQEEPVRGPICRAVACGWEARAQITHVVRSCAGQGLARLEAHAVLRALVTQVNTIGLGDPVRGLYRGSGQAAGSALRRRCGRPQSRRR